MVSKSKGDPLSRYFKDLNESDLDSDSDASEDNDDVSKHTNTSTKPAGDRKDNENEEDVDALSMAKGSSTQKLPSARDCFGNKSNPTFLNLHQKREINWDQSTHLKLLGDDESQVIDYKSNAVPPPTSYEPVTESTTKVVDSEGKKRKSAADELDEQRISSKTCRLDGGTAQSTEAAKS